MKKILIIDDDFLTAKIYRAALEKESYEVEVAHDGKSGLERLIEFRPDGVLLDLMLPKMSGIELLANLRALDFFARLPVIVYTNAFVPQMIRNAEQAGASMVF